MLNTLIDRKKQYLINLIKNCDRADLNQMVKKSGINSNNLSTNQIRAELIKRANRESGSIERLRRWEKKIK